MRNPFAALVERKSGGVWSGPLGSLVASYLRDADAIGAGISEEQAMRVAAAHSCVNVIAQNIAALPLPTYKQLERGKQKIGFENSLVRVLATPNPWQTGQDWREQMTAHLLLRGNAYSWVSWVNTVGRDGRLLEQADMLVPLNPDRVEVEAVVDAGQKLTGRRYWLHRDNGQRVELPADEVFHITGLSTNGITGRSVLSDAREVFGVALATQRYAGRLFENDATPGVVLEHPKTLTPGAAQRIRETWEGSHRGQTRKTAVLEEGMKLSRLSLTAEDAQFLETRKFQRAEIAGLFRVPPHLIGDVERSTSWGTGIEQQQIAFVQLTLLPWMKKWENTIRRVLILAERDLFVEHRVEGFMRGDSAARGQFYNTMVSLGIYTRNEVRELENMNPLEGLDEPLTPMNLAGESNQTDESEDEAA